MIVVLCLCLLFIIVVFQQRKNAAVSRMSKGDLNFKIQPSLSDIDQLLPNEIRFQIFSKLDLSSLVQCQLVSKDWNAFIGENKFIEPLVREFSHQSRDKFLNYCKNAGIPFQEDKAWMNYENSKGYLADAAVSQMRKKYLLEFTPEALEQLAYTFRIQTVPNEFARYFIKMTATITSEKEREFQLGKMIIDSYRRRSLQWIQPQDTSGECHVIFNLYDILVAKKLTILHLRVLKPMQWTFQIFPSDASDRNKTFLMLMSPFAFYYFLKETPHWFWSRDLFWGCGAIVTLAAIAIPTIIAHFINFKHPVKSYLDQLSRIDSIITTSQLMVLWILTAKIESFVFRTTLPHNRQKKTLWLFSAITIISFDWTAIANQNRENINGALQICLNSVSLVICWLVTEFTINLKNIMSDMTEGSLFDFFGSRVFIALRGLLLTALFMLYYLSINSQSELRTYLHQR